MQRREHPSGHRFEGGTADWRHVSPALEGAVDTDEGHVVRAEVDVRRSA